MAALGVLRPSDGSALQGGQVIAAGSDDVLGALRPEGVAPDASEEILRLTRTLEARGAECALFGSVVTGRWWEGSDINLLAAEPSQEPVTSSATNYVLGDWALDTPRITKQIVSSHLLQLDVYPILVLERALDDWILCDRLYHAVPIGHLRGRLAKAISTVQKNRDDPGLRGRRVQWYVRTSRELLEAADDPHERSFATRVAAILLGCAQLEAVGSTKGSYKRLYRQCQSAFAESTVRQAFETIYAVEPMDGALLTSLLTRGLGLVGEMRSWYESHPEQLDASPPGLRQSLVTTLGIASDGIPTGKGILENLAIGDGAAALDSLRKSTLWLTNAAIKVELQDRWPAPGHYLEALAQLPIGRATLVPYFSDLFGLDADIDVLDDAVGHVIEHI